MLFMLLLTFLAAPTVQPSPANMATYQMVLLRKGPVPPPSDVEMRTLQSEHLARLADLNQRGVNLLYGPVTAADADLVGIAVLAVQSADEARRAFDDDPFVKRRMLTIDVRPWLGPKDRFGLPPTHDVSAPGALESLVLGFLADGPDRTQDAATGAELQKGHLAYMTKLREEGKLPLAGPFMDTLSPRGILIYRVGNVAEAQALAAQDPDVKAGRLVLVAYPWTTLKGMLK